MEHIDSKCSSELKLFLMYICSIQNRTRKRHKIEFSYNSLGNWTNNHEDNTENHPVHRQRRKHLRMKAKEGLIKA